MVTVSPYKNPSTLMSHYRFHLILGGGRGEQDPACLAPSSQNCIAVSKILHNFILMS